MSLKKKSNTSTSTSVSTTASSPWEKYENPEIAQKLIHYIKEKTAPGMKFMEVCGTHTTNISRYGLRRLLNEGPELVSGPGCPVCVTDPGDVENFLTLARQKNVVLTTFGDLLKIPGESGSLSTARACGADIRVVYSPSDAVQIAAENPGRETVFLGAGFETTTPAVLLALKEAIRLGLNNFSLYLLHKITTRAVHHLLETGGTSLNGFLLPGHVSAVTGRHAWDYISELFGLPAVVTGFALNDILWGIRCLSDLNSRNEAAVINGYQRVVKETGNTRAQELIKMYLEKKTSAWRGMGEIPASGLFLKEEYAFYDARHRFSLPPPGKISEPEGCLCGEILKGNRRPFDCKLFAKTCFPEEPAGPCMVSSEGACAAYYYYEKEA